MKKLTVRLHDDLYEQVKVVAGAHLRSINGEIAVALTGYVARETKSRKRKEKKGGKSDD